MSTPGVKELTRRALRAVAAEAFAACEPPVDPQIFGWESRPVVAPPDGRAWGVETLRMGGEDVDTTWAPFYQLTLQAPANEATRALDRMADALGRSFARGRLVRVLAENGALLLLLVSDGADESAVISGDAAGWSACPVRIGLRVLADHRAHPALPALVVPFVA